MRIQLIALTGILVSISGCGPSLEGLRQEHGEQAERQLSQIEMIVADAEKRPPVTKSFLDPAVKGFTFGRQANDYRQDPGNAQTLLIDAWQERDKPFVKGDDPPVCGHWWFFPHRSRSATAEQLTKDDLKQLERDFRILIGTEYVVVIKTREFVAPEHTFGTSYSLGRLKADAHLYRLEDASHLGAVNFTAHTPVIGVMGMDLTISGKDQKKTIRELIRRTQDEAHEMAQAKFGELSGKIKTRYKIEVDDHYGHKTATWKD